MTTKEETTPRSASRAWLMIGLGFVITFVGAVSYFVFFAQFPALRDLPWVNVPLVVLGCGLSFRGLRAAFKESGAWLKRSAALLSTVLSLAITGLFLAYIGYISYQMPEPTAAATSIDSLPEFELLNQHGETVSRATYSGKNLVLVFYRGFW